MIEKLPLGKKSYSINFLRNGQVQNFLIVLSSLHSLPPDSTHKIFCLHLVAL